MLVLMRASCRGYFLDACLVATDDMRADEIVLVANGFRREKVRSANTSSHCLSSLSSTIYLQRAFPTVYCGAMQSRFTSRSENLRTNIWGGNASWERCTHTPPTIPTGLRSHRRAPSAASRQRNSSPVDHAPA